ncbi:CBS domain containing protein [Rhynchospora pubera]|uniref:CBS domain containing protein n=1 Tax=Rhynchospora pubera TaxID=906938 RepID=A0AAV8BZ90_9POAL|nr:CBS domain containing protein [Rhynchospora pubera]KAJ4798547.1 CBS domain containing protein [Rhynchospora pubera]
MSMLFIHHVIGDLTVGKPDLMELYDSDTLEVAARVIAASPEASTVVLRRSPESGVMARDDRFVGLINPLEILGFLARNCPDGDHLQRENLMKVATVKQVVVPDQGSLKEIDPGTRLIDALEMMKQGVKRLIVRKSGSWRGFSKRFSVIYNGKWLKNNATSSNATTPTSTSSTPRSLATTSEDKFCSLSREDIVRFLIGCLGALAPIPLTSISSLGAISTNFAFVEGSSPALEAVTKMPLDPCAVAVVEMAPDGTQKIIGDISAYKLWKCDYSSAAWALANLSAAQFVIGSDENGSGEITVPVPDITPSVDDGTPSVVPGVSPKKRFSSRSIGFFNNRVDGINIGAASLTRGRSMYRGRSAPLTCKHDSSLAAVMAQVLSHRATHVWVTDGDTLVGIVGYVEIIDAVTKRAAPSTS